MSDLRALTLALPFPVVVVAADARVLALNAAAIDMLGGDVTGRHYITALRQPAVLDAVEATMADGDDRLARYLANDGARDTTWDVNIRAAQTQDGPVVVLGFQDLTALEEAGEMRRDFVSNVSHELRTPLTSLLGFIETLRGPARDDPSAQDRFLGIMEHEAGRMHRLVEDLLQLSRVEGQERMRPTTKLSLSDLIGEVIAALKPLAQGRQVTFKTDLPAADVQILGDREQLWQVISNLAENAIKYGAPEGIVTISLDQPKYQPMLLTQGVHLGVRDQGEGIAPHHIARLTERFYRVDSHRSREVGGTGLGLAITKHIINRHRGRLKVDSTLGEGTEFAVILPVNAD